MQVKAAPGRACKAAAGIRPGSPRNPAMAYKTLFTVVTAATGDPGVGGDSIEALDAAIALARAEDAHLEVLALGIDHTQIGYFYAGASAMIYQETLERAQEEAAAQEAQARRRLSRHDLRWSIDTAVAQLGGMSGLIAQRARFADLAVMPRPYGPGRGTQHEAAVEAALFEGQVPLLVVPDGLTDPGRFDRVVIAWNQSSEAMAAIRHALPVLRRATVVNIAVIDPPQHGAERSDPGGPIGQMLSRHGVRSEVSVLARTMPRTSDVIARHVADIGADLLVMGAYGHSRFRQAILGGTTRNTLEQSAVPVLMAH
jgi:nucleotide-binding universal stress UspA family protein